ncbi:MAG: M48 family metalloprotease [Methylophilaceae bacterium]|nr:M48 family metalloprotease [Methylophilaceae bacterium]
MKMRHLWFAFMLLAPLARAEGLPDLGDYAQTVLPPQEERRIGEEIMREIRASGQLVADVEVADYLGALGYRLASNSPDNRQAFTFFVIQDPTINAFALPGGFIGVHTGLIQSARSESELASVVAHEIGHVVQRHLARMVAQQRRDTLPSIAAMAVAILMARANPELAKAGVSAVQAGTVQRQLDYTREHEREADRIGLQILHDSGFDVRAMPAFFETLLKGTRFHEGSAPSFLRTHPLTTERIADVANRVEQLPYRQVPDSLEFHLIRAKLRAMQGAPADAVQFFEEGLRNGTYAMESAQRYGLALALLRSHELERAQHEIDTLRSQLPRHPMVEVLAAQVLSAAGHVREALASYREALALFPKHRGLVHGYAELLLLERQAEEAVRFLREQQLVFPNDGYLYQLQSQAYTQLGKNLLRHQAQGEAYVRAYDLAGAVNQMELALKSGDGDFYQLSIVEARLKELRQLMGDTKKR